MVSVGFQRGCGRLCVLIAVFFVGYHIGRVTKHSPWDPADITHGHQASVTRSLDTPTGNLNSAEALDRPENVQENKIPDVDSGGQRIKNSQPLINPKDKLIGKHIPNSNAANFTPTEAKTQTPNNRANKTSPRDRCNVFDIRQNTSDTSECVTANFPSLPFIICIHPPTQDVWVSTAYKRGRVWELKIMRVFQRHLIEDPELGVIDIGCNIGQYTLLAAMMKRPVVAVDARLKHVQMLHHSVITNNLQDQDIVLVHNAVSDNHDLLSLVLTEPKNQGHTQVGKHGKGHGINALTETTDVRAIFMDDLLSVVKFSKAIIKMDIEGAEYQAVAHCGKLLEEIYVPFIFMEWNLNTGVVEKRFIKETLEGHRYTAHGLTGKPLGTNHAEWPGDIIWKRERTQS